MINDIVTTALEVIFGIWMLNVFSTFLLDIDFIEIIRKAICKIVNKL